MDKIKEAEIERLAKEYCSKIDHSSLRENGFVAGYKAALQSSAPLQENYDKLLESYSECVDKFDNCRACLARIAEKLNIELDQTGIAPEWHEQLIEALDKWQSSAPLDIVKDLTRLHYELIADMPTGEIKAWDVITVVTAHNNKLLKLIEKYESSAPLQKEVKDEDKMQKLFNYLEDQHGIILLQSDEAEIENIINPKTYPYNPFEVEPLNIDEAAKALYPYVTVDIYSPLSDTNERVYNDAQSKRREGFKAGAEWQSKQSKQ